MRHSQQPWHSFRHLLHPLRKEELDVKQLEQLLTR